MKTKFLILAIIIQIIILLSLYINTQIPLYFGKEIKIFVSPVDPRDIFRGNYIELSYNFPYTQKQTKKGIIYAVLKKDGDIYVFDKFVVNKPKNGVFIKGKINNKNIEYRIEAFFMPKDKAKEMEKTIRNKNAIATLMVLNNGKAAIKDLSLK